MKLITVATGYSVNQIVDGGPAVSCLQPGRRFHTIGDAMSEHRKTAHGADGIPEPFLERVRSRDGRVREVPTAKPEQAPRVVARLARRPETGSPPGVRTPTERSPQRPVAHGDTRTRAAVATNAPRPASTETDNHQHRGANIAMGAPPPHAAAAQRPGNTNPVGEPTGVVAAAAELLVERSDNGWLRLLDQHADDGSGHCAVCGVPARPVWPCMLWTIARHAQLLAQRRRGPAGRPGAPEPA